MVLPGFRRGGVATRLVEQLLVRTDAALVAVRVDPANEGALAALRSWGWTRLGALNAPVATVPLVGSGSTSEIWSRPVDA
jgi:ribosomal protein S18 acetylase RimI-like enzyme